MKVKDMIEQLKKLKPNQEVLICDRWASGDEGVFKIVSMEKNVITIEFEQAP